MNFLVEDYFYIYADGQILAKCDHTGASVEDYFYITDRQGSVRVIADDGGAAQVSYTYDPFGVVIEENGTFANPFKFTGQWYDEEIDQYYLRARMYDPRLMRFTGYDPVRGDFNEPLTLHRYLYCENDPINWIDPTGEFRFARRDLKDSWLPYSRFYITPAGIYSGLLNVGYYHEAGFYQDNSGDFASYGSLGFEYPDEYSISAWEYDDEIMRQAQYNVDNSNEFRDDNFGLFHNCQDYCTALRKEYKRLGGKVKYRPFNRGEGMIFIDEEE